jgi:anaerobic ribonucleoside-triphosphate reductase
MRHFSAPEQATRAAVQLTNEERQPCEVWTRVMGYHRPVASFNTGKRGEHAERRFFAEHADGCRSGTC